MAMQTTDQKSHDQILIGPRALRRIDPIANTGTAIQMIMSKVVNTGPIISLSLIRSAVRPVAMDVSASVPMLDAPGPQADTLVVAGLLLPLARTAADCGKCGQRAQKADDCVCDFSYCHFIPPSVLFDFDLPLRSNASSLCETRSRKLKQRIVTDSKIRKVLVF